MRSTAALALTGSFSASSTSMYLPWRTSSTPPMPRLPSALWMALPCGSSTPFFKVMRMRAFMVASLASVFTARQQGRDGASDDVGEICSKLVELRASQPAADRRAYRRSPASHLIEFLVVHRRRAARAYRCGLRALPLGFDGHCWSPSKSLPDHNRQRWPSSPRQSPQFGFCPLEDTSTGPLPLGRGFSFNSPSRRATSW